MDFRKIAVVGAGTMGNGISQAFAQAGVEVALTDMAQAQLDRAMKTEAGSFDRLVKKEKMSEADKAAALARIRTSTDLAAIKDCDLVIEAATENLDLKMKIVRQMDELAAPGAIIASNTSSISITRLAAATKRAEKIISGNGGSSASGPTPATPAWCGASSPGLSPPARTITARTRA